VAYFSRIEQEATSMNGMPNNTKNMINYHLLYIQIIKNATLSS
jgi:hypothetical protein